MAGKKATAMSVETIAEKLRPVMLNMMLTIPNRAIPLSSSFTMLSAISEAQYP